MTTTRQPHEHITQRVRRRAGALLFGASTAVATLLRPAFRHHLATIGAVAVVAASSLLTPQPAATATAHPVQVIFDDVQFTHVDDGCCTDTTMEVYGSLAAVTSAGAASADGRPNRNFGTWGQLGAGCATDGVWWPSSGGERCPKQVAWNGSGWTDKLGFYYFMLCQGSTKDTCGTTYSGHNNTIIVHAHAGETITVSVAMQDYDELSANDDVCKGSKKFGPFTDAQLQSYAYAGNFTIAMADNGHAACAVHFRLG